jgi:hypothetical protein
VISISFIDGNRGVYEVIELRELIDIIPDFFIGGMEDMGSINVDVDAVFISCIYISTNVFPFVDDKASITFLS